MKAKGLELGTSALFSHWMQLSLGWGHNLWLRAIPREGPSCLASADNTFGSQENECLGSEWRTGQHMPTRD